MDEESFKFKMDQLRKYERQSEWFPAIVVGIFLAGLWWNGIDPEPQVNTVLAAIAVVGYLVYREVCALRALTVRAHLLSERSKARAEEAKAYTLGSVLR